MYRYGLLKRQLLLLILLTSSSALLPSVATCQTPKIVGHWEGSIEVPGSPIPISVDFTAKPDGSLSATITIPAQGARDVPLASVVAIGVDVSFQIPGVPGDPAFNGTLDAGGDRIAGDFKQGGATLKFALERRPPPEAAAREALAGFDEAVPEMMKKFDVPGMAIAIVKGKQVVYARAFGYRDTEKKLPVTADTLFAIGSSSKAFTTFVLGTLVDEGKIEWDKPLRNYIPWFRLYNESMGERLTPRDLVTHRSGLPRHDLVWYNNYGASRQWLVERLAYLEPSADLREKFQYNNLMFLTAGYLSEVITGKTWEENVRQRILDPLGMARTNFSVLDSQKDPDFAQPYQKKEGKVQIMPFRVISNLGPAGSINSSANEMSRWVIVHLNGGQFEKKKLANTATVQDMHLAHMATGATPQIPDISPADYGMGWFTQSYRGHNLVEHGGNIDGFSANVALLPQDDIGIVILTNLNGTSLRDLITYVIADRLLGLKPIDWIGQGAARRAVAEAAAKEGEKKKEVTRVPGTHPSHRLDDYAGDYENPGYGPLKVRVSGDQLEATFNGITTPLGHWHYDSFNGLKAADATFQEMKFGFLTDNRGFIYAVSAPLEPSVKEIVFTKKPEARLYDAEYLKRYVGNYDLPGQPVALSLKGNVLTATLPGAPPFDLMPLLGGDFGLKQIQVITIHFLADETGDVTGLEFRQPGTVLTAKKRKQ
jgi:CubicO group peptidase (beta-lactamase class C family)